LEWWCLL